MGYMHIENLYKAQEILEFKRCYAMEKIHGTSAHISYRDGKLSLSPGGESLNRFAAVFDLEALESRGWLPNSRLRIQLLSTAKPMAGNNRV